jgi:uroporphyrin-III C-methyltransferase
MKDWKATLPELQPGWVWLAGAGPGDPGLLTLLALKALGEADVVVHDALIGPQILSFARPDAHLEFVGKRGGHPSPGQAEISQLLVLFAREGKRVLRLKGGDPFVFGRGAEEALALVRAGIPFRVVPGVTAGIGGLAYAGIPATSRETNSAITFITGHGAFGDVPGNIDWAGLAKASPVLVIYMPLRHVGEIRDILLQNGRPEGEAVAIVGHASLEEQTVLETTLGALAEDFARHPIESPALMVVGEIVRLRRGLDWRGAAQGRLLDPDPLVLLSDLAS